MRYNNVTVEKANGVVYTPSDLANYVANEMLSRYTEIKDSFSILDPAIGNGELIIALINEIERRFNHPKISVFGYETNTVAINQTMLRISERCPSAQLTIEKKDFLDISNVEFKQNYDFIIANPPYIRTQILGAEKAQRIASLFGLNGRIDIYYAFLMLTEQLLNNNGIAGFITSNKFMTIRAGEAVRKHFVNTTDILQIVDFGDTKIFSASVLPCVIVFRKKKASVIATHTSIYETKDNHGARCLKSIFDGLNRSNVVKLENGHTFNVICGTLQASADGSPWRINTINRNSWLKKVERNTVKRFSDLGKIRVGIKTTADNVFIKSSWENEACTPELLKPLITHRNAGQISSDNSSHWLVLYTHTVEAGKKVVCDIKQYPNTLKYLESHRKQLEERTYIQKAKRNWYEIWVPQNPAAWAYKKIVFRDIADTPQFWLDETGAIVNGDCYWMELYDHISEDELLLALAIANSEFIKQFYDVCFNNKLYSGKRRFMAQYVEQFPLPNPSSPYAQAAINAVKEILHLAPTPQEKKKQLQTISDLVDTLFTL